MIANRLVKLIEDHSDALANGLVDRLRQSSRTVGYFKIPQDDLRQAAYDLYHHLGDWLNNKTETDIEYRFTQLGSLRAEQGIPLSDFVWGLIITKESLWRFIQMQGVSQIFELYGELELIQLIDQFFDRALYYVTVGYARAEHAARKAA
jgi:hypothetical protein